MLSGGYTTLIRAIAGNACMRLGWRSELVSVYTADGVAVRDTTGIRRGTHAVGTVPLGVLKKGSPAFSPSLPPDRTAAIERLGFGCLEKVALLFERPFWREAGAPRFVPSPRKADEPMMWVLGNDAFGGGPAPVAEIFHSATYHIRGKSPAESASWVLSTVSEALGSPCPIPETVAVSSWADDPYSAGVLHPHSAESDPGRRRSPRRTHRRPARRSPGSTPRAACGLHRRRHGQRYPRSKTAGRQGPHSAQDLLILTASNEPFRPAPSGRVTDPGHRYRPH